MAKFVACLAFVAMLSLAHSSPMERTGESILRNKLEHLSNSQTQFSSDLFRAIYDERSDENILVSPYSVYRFLTLLYLAAGGETEKSLERSLHLDWAEGNKDFVYAAYLGDIEARAANNFVDSELDVADRLYVDNNTTVEADFLAKFGSIFEKLNFAQDAEVCREYINDFIAKATRNKICNLMTPDDVNKFTSFVVVNAVYFRANWLKQFQSEDTEIRSFHGLKGTGDVEMMTQHNVFKTGYSRSWDAYVLELPYDGVDDTIAMYIAMPRPENSSKAAFDGFVHRMTPDILRNLPNSFNYDNVFVALPKMNFTENYSLSGIFGSMGLDHLSGSTSNYTAVSKTSSLSFEDIRHAAIMEVDENGTVAAAVTYTAGRGMTGTFICDRPFLFTVYDKELEQVLFTGTYTNPQ